MIAILHDLTVAVVNTALEVVFLFAGREMWRDLRRGTRDEKK